MEYKSCKGFEMRVKRVYNKHLKLFGWTSTGINNLLNKSIISITDGKTIEYDKKLFDYLKDLIIRRSYIEAEKEFYHLENGFLIFNEDKLKEIENGSK